MQNSSRMDGDNLEIWAGGPIIRDTTGCGVILHTATLILLWMGTIWRYGQGLQSLGTLQAVVSYCTQLQFYSSLLLHCFSRGHGEGYGGGGGGGEDGGYLVNIAQFLKELY